ncbi:MAG: beta-lactamase family protein [Clostridia bacterium]|nr:beta-lactamase family protein [Clostridia bacterium]
MFENIKKILDISRKLGIPAMDCAVYHQGKEVFREIRGSFDEQGTALTGKELYNLYSCSKPITCAAALQLLEKGKFKLDDDLAEYMPEFKDMTILQNGAIFKAEKKIKIRHLFTMTAGLDYAVADEAVKAAQKATDGRCPTRETMKYIAKRPLDFEPGEKWQYSLCHDVLAAFVEVVSGKTFGQCVKENIFNPLGMKDATFLYPEGGDERTPEQYTYIDATKEFKKMSKRIAWYQFGPEYESGGAGGIMTPEDYAKFAEGLRLNKILKAETLQLMMTDQLNDKTRASCWIAKGYGYGLGVRCPLGDGVRSDIGWGGAAGAYLAVDPKNEISVVYFQHVQNTPNRDLRKDFIEAAKLDLGYSAFEKDMWQGTASSLA